MKIKYEFSDGSISEVEVDEIMGNKIKEIERKMENYERKCRYWCTCSLDQMDYEGEWFADKNTPATIYEISEEEENVKVFMETLTPIQRKRFKMKLDNPKLSFREISRIEKVNIKTIIDSFSLIKQKYLRFCSNTPIKSGDISPYSEGGEYQ